MGSILPFLIVCPLTFIGGFIDAIAGGGGLVTLPAYMLAGLPPHFAIATNKMSSTMGTSVATARLAKSGYIPWKQALWCVITACIGSACGANLALRIDAEIIKRLMLIVIPVAAFFVLRGTALQEKSGKEITHNKQLFRSVLIALGIGIYDGLYGPGTGTFLILLLTSFAGYGLKEANGVTKAINLTTNIAALTVYILNAKVMFILGLAGGICNIIGNYIGISFFKEKGIRIVRPIMLFVMALFFIRILSEIL